MDAIKDFLCAALTGIAFAVVGSWLTFLPVYGLLYLCGFLT